MRHGKSTTHSSLILRSGPKDRVSKDGDAAHASRRTLRALLSMRSETWLLSWWLNTARPHGCGDVSARSSDALSVTAAVRLVVEPVRKLAVGRLLLRLGGFAAGLCAGFGLGLRRRLGR